MRSHNISQCFDRQSQWNYIDALLNPGVRLHVGRRVIKWKLRRKAPNPTGRYHNHGGLAARRLGGYPYLSPGGKRPTVTVVVSSRCYYLGLNPHLRLDNILENARDDRAKDQWPLGEPEETVGLIGKAFWQWIFF